MSSNDNLPSDTTAEFATLDELERQLTVGISLAEAKTQRLLNEAYISPAGAERSLRKLIRRVGVEQTIKVMTGKGFANAHHFGPLRGAVMRWQRPAAEAAQERLPDALRDLYDLNNRLAEVQVARQNLRSALALKAKVPSPSSTPANFPEQKNVKRMRRRRF